jgi:hypothetical protein
MSLPPSHHAFLQRATLEGCEERGFVDGRAGDIQTRRVDAAPHVIRRRGVLEVVRAGVGWLLRGAGLLIYLAPALILIKLFLYLFIDEEISDYVIVVFVGLVVAFFAALNLYIFASIVWWVFGRSPRPFRLKRPFDDDGRAALPPAGGITDVGPEPAPIGQLVRARGAIVRLGPNREGDGTVLRDLWFSGNMDLRLTEAIDFAVVARGQIPVVVRLGGAPMVVAKPASASLSEFASGAAAGTMNLLDEPRSAAAIEGSLLSLREGDEVEVIGVVASHIDNIDGFDLGGTVASVPLRSEHGDAASPFRDRPGGAGLILGEGPAAPISIRRYDAS